MKQVGMLFPGYGSQFVGMGKDLYDQSRIVQERFEEASDCLSINFVKLCFASSEVELNKITNGYLALFVLQSAIVDELAHYNIKPSLVGGVDGGEYTALYAAGSLSFADALYFINKYASAYEALIAAGDYAHVCVSKCPEETVTSICEKVTQDNDYASISLYQSSTQQCVGGTVKAVLEAKELLKKKRASVRKIPLGVGLHSFAMDPIVKSIKMYLQKVDFKSTTIPFVSGLIGQTLTDGELIASAIMQQIHAPCHLSSILQSFESFPLVVQVGPGTSFEQLLLSIFPDKRLYTIDNFKSLNVFKNEFK